MFKINKTRNNEAKNKLFLLKIINKNKILEIKKFLKTY